MLYLYFFSLWPNFQEAISYVDDIYLGTESKDFNVHLRSLRELFRRLRIANLKLKPEKLNIAGECLDIVGYIWRNGTFSIPKQKCSAIRNFQTPRTQTHVRSFIAMANYFRFFIYKFATIAAPLTELTRKEYEKAFVWTAEAQEAFTNL